jgi:hypothetical protein
VTRTVTVRSYNEMIRVDGQRVNPCVTSAIQTARSTHSRKPSERLPMLPPKLGTSNIRTPGTCHACSRKVPSERANLNQIRNEMWYRRFFANHPHSNRCTLSTIFQMNRLSCSNRETATAQPG